MKFRIVVYLKNGGYVRSNVDIASSADMMSTRADMLRDSWDAVQSLTIEQEDGDIVLIPKENVETIAFEKEEE